MYLLLLFMERTGPGIRTRVWKHIRVAAKRFGLCLAFVTECECVPLRTFACVIFLMIDELERIWKEVVAA
jgi:hypothetical protein